MYKQFVCFVFVANNWRPSLLGGGPTRRCADLPVYAYLSPIVRSYFNLRRQLLNRRLRAFGLPVGVSYVLAALLFCGLGSLLFARTALAPYAVVAAAWSAVYGLGERTRNDFLRLVFPGRAYWRIRLLENTVVLLPFTLLLLWYGSWALTLVQGLVGLAMVAHVHRRVGGRALPTPFGRFNYQAAVGLRRSWWVLAGAVFLLGKGVQVGNVELSYFAVAACAFAVAWWHQDPEPGYYVWVHARSPRAFLLHQWGRVLLAGGLTVLPLLVVIGYRFPGQAGWLLLTAAYLAVQWTFWITLKYAYYPQPVGVLPSFVVAFGILLPPLLLGLLPYYYHRAVGQLAYALLPVTEPPTAA